MSHMKKLLQRNKSQTGKSNKSDKNYTFLDFIFDVLSCIPELIFLPFKLIFWLLRSVGRLIGSVFDFV